MKRVIMVRKITERAIVDLIDLVMMEVVEVWVFGWWGIYMEMVEMW